MIGTGVYFFMAINIEESLCGGCVHFRRLLLDEMKNTFSLKCASMGRYIKTPKKTCNYYEPMTWEMFLETEEGEADEN